MEIGLGLPWPDGRDPAVPVVLGDLPVDRCGMVIGDATGLDAWTGIDGKATGGLADVTYWGRHADQAHARFGGERITRHGHDGPHGWLDLPMVEAAARVAELTAWRDEQHQGIGLMVSLDEHSDFYRFGRAGWQHPLHVGTIDVGGCRMIGIDWDPGDHSVRHRGERAHGQVYPVTLEADPADGTVLRWTIPPHDHHEDNY